MSESHITILIAIALLLCGSMFWIKKIWVGAVVAILFLLLKNTMLSSPGFNLGIVITDTLIIWVELSLLLSGAYMFCTVLQEKGQWDRFREKALSSDSTMDIVLLFGWFMIAFLEGIAGFGIPAMLVAPMLLSIGLKPVTSIVLPLAANAAPVTFGALGTPLKIGLGIHDTGGVSDCIVLLNFLPALLTPFALAFFYWKLVFRQFNLETY